MTCGETQDAWTGETGTGKSKNFREVSFGAGMRAVAAKVQAASIPNESARTEGSRRANLRSEGPRLSATGKLLAILTTSRGREYGSAGASPSEHDKEQQRMNDAHCFRFATRWWSSPAGCTRGIGRAIAEGFVQRGGQVVLTGRTAEGGPRWPRVGPGAALPPIGLAVMFPLCRCRATRGSSARPVGHVDTLVNVAGVNRRKPGSGGRRRRLSTLSWIRT